MNLVAILGLALCLYTLIHTYVVFPAMLRIRARRCDPVRGARSSSHRPVRIVLAVHNEDAVLEESLRSILASTLDPVRWTLHIRSDASTDGTDAILAEWAARHEHIHVERTDERMGKIGQLNRFFAEVEARPGEVLVLTDANVRWAPDLLERLVAAFDDPAVGLAQPVIANAVGGQAVAQDEALYIGREMALKTHESRVHGVFMGAFGACYAIRRSLARPMPDDLLVDDFYQSMSALSTGARARVVEDARCTEDLPGHLAQEFRRKRRIAAGNWQNLRRWWPVLMCRPGVVRRLFVQHKLLRWLGPFLLLGSCIFAGAWATGTSRGLVLFSVCAAFGALLLLVPTGVFRSPVLRPLHVLRYFLWMNLAAGLGFIDHIKGIETNVWEPTQRDPTGQRRGGASGHSGRQADHRRR